MKGLLVLEDGAAYRGEAIGRPGTSFGEIVFNTAMSGYQEVLTDPSYAGQIVVMTAAHVGNYGVREAEAESDRVHVAGFLARDFPTRWSGSGGEQSLAEYLEKAGVLGLHGLDTRALVRRIRTEGAMRSGLSTEIDDPEELRARVLASPRMEGSDLALAVSPSQTTVFEAPGAVHHVAAVDYGMKRNIVRLLNAAGCRVTVFPATASADAILASDPDGIFLSNGPGDPAALASPIATIEKLIGKRPIFGICLGHQLLGLAFGARTFKLKFGHRGANHPVGDLQTGAVAITSQNHGFAVDPGTLPAEIEPTHRNLNDGTLEGFRHRELPILAAQFHPEAAPGPHDANVLFESFIDAMRRSPSRMAAAGP
ncbi:MAG TPA: glutamine-hydrolyzing carbamoyl-phosphate synthase small subunit [Thermoanaerobaculia bacterium]|nr:glutamine-hydrolyzing carbamoyl-phosphate synthase small subunit [Thermoanaerobaculia bacterium]